MALTSQDWSISGLAVELRKDKRTIATIIDESQVKPVCKKGKSNLYKMVDIVAAMLGSEELDLQQEKAKLAVEQTRRLQRNNDIAEKVFAPVEILSDSLESACKIIVSHLDSIPLTLKKRNPNLTGKDIEIVKKVIAKCRNTAAGAAIKILDE